MKFNDDDDIVDFMHDWKFEERLSKEFEAVGFFISDHPLNQFKEIFDDYKIIDFNKFNFEMNKRKKYCSNTY